MLKLSLSVLALSVILWSANAQTNPCEESCHIGKRGCMHSCNNLFKDERQCTMVCEHADRECMHWSRTTTCMEDCLKHSHNTPTKCADRCGVDANQWIHRHKPLVGK